MKIKIITGPVHTGKSTYLSKVVDPFTWGGLLCPLVNGLKKLQNVSTGEIIDFETKEILDDNVSIGKYVFLKSSFDKAESWTLSHVVNENTKYILIDEIGKLELMNLGFHDLLNKLYLKDINKELVLVVRDYLVEDVIKKYSFHDFQIIIAQKNADPIQPFFE